MSDIFGKIVGGINKGVATVGANSKAMVEKAKINATINNLEAERKQLVHLLGARVYDMYKANSEVSIDEGITNFVQEIEKRLELIIEQKEQLSRIEEEVSMVTSGTKPVAQGSASCVCGQINQESAKFCVACGNQM